MTNQAEIDPASIGPLLSAADPKGNSYDLFADDADFHATDRGPRQRLPSGGADSPRFVGDTGQLPEAACIAYQELLKREFVSRSSRTWRDLLAHRGAIESRLSELNLMLVCDEERGFAYKVEADIEGGYSLLAKKPISMMDSVLLIYLRMQLAVAGYGEDTVVETSDIFDNLRPYRAPEDTNLARHDERISRSIETLVKYRLITPIAGTGRYVVEPVLAAAFPLELITALNDLYHRRATVQPDAGHVVEPGARGGSDDE